MNRTFLIRRLTDLQAQHRQCSWVIENFPAPGPEHGEAVRALWAERRTQWQAHQRQIFRRIEGYLPWL